MADELEPEGTTAILLVLQNHVIEAIDKQLIHMPYPQACRTSFCRALVHEVLGFPPPQFHTTAPQRDALRDLDLNRLQPDAKRVVELYLEGGNLSDICKQMIAEDHPTRRGGQWHHHTVRNLLLEAHKEKARADKSAKLMQK